MGTLIDIALLRGGRGLMIACVLVAGMSLCSTSHAGGTRAVLERGVAALEAGDTERALALFVEVCEAAPQWAYGFLYRGIAEARLRPESPAAIAALERAVALAADNPRARYHLGAAYLRAKRPADALEHLRRAEELRPGYRDLHFLLATALAAADELDEAIAAYETVLRESSGHLGALAALAGLYEKRERKDDAERALVTITQLQPGVAYHHYQLGQFYERIGESRKARRAFRRADELDPRPRRKMRQLR